MWFVIGVASAGDTAGGAAFRFPRHTTALGFAGGDLVGLTTDDRIVSVALPDGRVGEARPVCEYASNLAPDGDRVAMTCDYQSLVLLSWPSLTPVGRAPYGSGDLVWADDGSALAVNDGQQITWFDRSLRQVGQAPLAVGNLCGRGGAWFGSGVVAGGGEGVVSFGADGAVRWQVPGRAERLALSADGERLLVGRYEGFDVLDAATGRVRGSVPRTEGVYEAVGTSEGWWVSAADGFDRIDASGKVLGHVAGRGHPIASNDGARVALSYGEPVPRVFRADGTPLHDERLTGDLVAVAGRRGALVALGGSGEVLDLGPGGVRVRGLVPEARDLAVGPGGVVVVVAGARLVVLDPRGGARDVPGLAEDEGPVAVRADGSGWVVATDRGFRAFDGAALGPLRPAPNASLEHFAVGAGRIATAGSLGFDVWDGATGRPLLEANDGEVWGLGIRSDGSVVAGATRDGYDGDVTRVTVAPGPAAEPWDLCCDVGVSPDGRYVVEVDEREVRARDPVRREVVARWTLPAPADSVWVPSPDTVVVELEDGRLHAIDASGIRAPELAPAPPLHLPTVPFRPAEGDRIDGWAAELRWTASGRLLRVGSAVDELDPRTGVVRTRYEAYGFVHAAPVGDDLVVLSHEGSSTRLVRVRPDRQYAWELDVEPHQDLFVGGPNLVVAGGPEFEVRDVATGALRWRGGRERSAAALSADGAVIAAVEEGALELIAAADGAVIRKLPVSEPCAVAFSPDGARIAAADDAGRTWLVPVGGGAPVPLDGIGRCPSLGWSPDGASLATRRYGELLVWDARTGSATAAYTLGQGSRLAWGPAGLATDDDGATLIVRP